MASKFGALASIPFTSRLALPESHTPISRMTIAPRAVSPMLTIRGSRACTSIIRFVVSRPNITISPFPTRPNPDCYRVEVQSVISSKRNEAVLLADAT